MEEYIEKGGIVGLWMGSAILAAFLLGLFVLPIMLFPSAPMSYVWFFFSALIASSLAGMFFEGALINYSMFYFMYSLSNMVMSALLALNGLIMLAGEKLMRSEIGNGLNGEIFSQLGNPYWIYFWAFLGFNTYFVIYIIRYKKYLHLLWLILPILTYVVVLGVFGLGI